MLLDRQTHLLSYSVVQVEPCGFCKASFYFLRGSSNKLIPEFRRPIDPMLGLDIAFGTVSRFRDSHFD